LKVTRQIRALSKEAAFKEDREYLISIPGIGLITAIVFLTEIIDINRFKTLDNLASFIGLAPREHSSSDKIQIGGLTKRGNKYLRNLLIEVAWIASRKDPALTMAYNKYMHMDGIDKRKAIIKIARKLLNLMRYVLKNHQPYVEGIVE
jgi:transposase